MAQVAPLQLPMHDFSAIVFKKLVEKFGVKDVEPAPFQPKCTTPAVIMDHCTLLMWRAKKRPRDAEWHAWRAWFLRRLDVIRQRRASNAARLLQTMDW